MARAVVLFLGLLAPLCACGTADDQAFYGQVASVELLQSKTVQKELRVSESQRDGLNKHADAYNTAAKAIADGLGKGTVSQSEARAKVLKAQDELKQNVLKVLTAEQVRRLGQITLQQMSYVALLDPIVQDRLGTTEAQKKSLSDGWTSTGTAVAQVERDAKEPIYKKYKAMQPKTDDERAKLQEQYRAEITSADERIRPKIQQLKKGFEDLVDRVLTSGQKQTWATLKGTPFKPASG